MALLQINIYKMKKITKGCAFQGKFNDDSPGDGKSSGESSWRVAFSPGDFKFTR